MTIIDAEVGKGESYCTAVNTVNKKQRKGESGDLVKLGGDKREKSRAFGMKEGWKESERNLGNGPEKKERGRER